MESYTIRNAQLLINGEQIAVLPEAIFIIDLGKIEVMVDEVILTADSIGILKLFSEKEPKSFNIRGKVDDKTLVIEKAMIYRLNLTFNTGESVLLKNILIRGLNAKWES